MQVKEIMEKKVISVKPSTTLKQLLKTFSKFHIFPLVPVVDGKEHLVGIVSFRNLIEAFKPPEPQILKSVPFVDEKEQNIFKMEITKEMGDLVVVDNIMETKFISIREDTSLEEAYKMASINLKSELPVVDDKGRLVGMIGIFDIVRHIFYEKGIIE